jgi:hypothetical protein
VDANSAQVDAAEAGTTPASSFAVVTDLSPAQVDTVEAVNDFVALIEVVVEDSNAVQIDKVFRYVGTAFPVYEPLELDFEGLSSETILATQKGREIIFEVETFWEGWINE